MSFGVFRIVCVANIALCTGDSSIGPPMSLHMFALTTSFVLQTPPCVQPIFVFFFRYRFTCLAYLGGLSFDLCECFTLFNDEASNFLTFYTETAKAVCDVCKFLQVSSLHPANLRCAMLKLSKNLRFFIRDFSVQNSQISVSSLY